MRRSPLGPDRAVPISSAASRVKPPASTDSRRSSTCWRAVSRSWLHSTARWRVWWRAWAVRLPRVRRRKRSSRRTAICSTLRAVVHAAASSMASGMPSRRTQIWARAGASASVKAWSATSARLRSTNSRGASYSSSASIERARLRPEGGRLRGRQRRHPPQHLARDAQRLPAGGEHPQQRAGPQEGVDQGRAGPQDVLAVVDHEDRLPLAEVVDEGVDQGPGRLLHHADGGGDGAGHQRLVGERGQVDEPAPVGVGRQRAAGDLERQAGLARPGRVR